VGAAASRITRISTSDESATIEVVRGRRAEAWRDDVRAFWAQRGALSEAEAERRLPEVVCVMRRGDAVAGVSSAFAADVPLIGGRRFWIDRHLLDDALADERPAMLQATFRALASDFDGDPASPIGVCALLTGGEERLRPEAQWSDPPMIYAGYLDGRQVRIGYFEGAQIGPGRAGEQPFDLEALRASGYRVELFAEQEAIGPADVVDLWVREANLTPAEAERRIAEVVVVATDRDARPAAVSTAYLAHNDQLGAELWYVRTFVAAAHRRTLLATAVVRRARDHLAGRFAQGLERRGIGAAFEAESELLRRGDPRAVWTRTESVFIGVNARGDHVRVHYFPGVLAPEPPG
jgi:hypothetical protein